MIVLTATPLSRKVWIQIIGQSMDTKHGTQARLAKPRHLQLRFDSCIPYHVAKYCKILQNISCDPDQTAYQERRSY